MTANQGMITGGGTSYQLNREPSNDNRTRPAGAEFNAECSYLNAATCPDCGHGMVRLGGCFSCPACGFSSCEL